MADQEEAALTAELAKTKKKLAQTEVMLATEHRRVTKWREQFGPGLRTLLEFYEENAIDEPCPFCQRPMGAHTSECAAATILGAA